MRIKPITRVSMFYSKTFCVAPLIGAYAKKGVGSLLYACHWARRPVSGMTSWRRSLQSDSSEFHS